MSKSADTFFVVLTNGRAENLGTEYKTWRQIIDWAYRQGISAGGNTPLPDKLYRNGVLVAEDLWSTAWHFHQSLSREIQKATQQLERTCPQPWQDGGGE